MNGSEGMNLNDWVKMHLSEAAARAELLEGSPELNGRCFSDADKHKILAIVLQSTSGDMLFEQLSSGGFLGT
jgi:hypothetical protein